MLFDNALFKDLSIKRMLVNSFLNEHVISCMFTYIFFPLSLSLSPTQNTVHCHRPRRGMKYIFFKQYRYIIPRIFRIIKNTSLNSIIHFRQLNSEASGRPFFVYSKVLSYLSPELHQCPLEIDKCLGCLIKYYSELAPLEICQITTPDIIRGRLKSPFIEP